MEAAAQKQLLAEAEYIALERTAEIKSEFVDGEMFAMAGGTARHSLLATTVTHLLWSQVRGKPCLVFGSDMRVRLPDGSHRYPDASALCHKPEFLEDPQDSLLNPALLVEVLSESSEAYDRGAKFRAYRQLPSFVDYLLVAQDQMLVEHYERRAGEWILHEHTGPEAVVKLASLDHAELRLKELYDQIELVEAS